MDNRQSVSIGENISGSIDSEAVAESVSYSLDIDGQRQKAQLDLYNAQIKKYKLRSDRYKWDTILRIGFSIIYTLFLFVWLYKVVHIVTHNIIYGYSLSDSVLITLLATTTANVFGMVIIVLKNLFPEKKDKNKPKPE
jgi:hypothetical protein